MLEYDITQLIPRFIQKDRNGYAMMKAIDAAMKILLDTAESALNTAVNVDEMPEWRLDELAWEYGVPWLPSADIAVKRYLIKNAFALSRGIGTANGMAAYLKAAFDDARAQPNGMPWIFNVFISGDVTADTMKWLNFVVENIKPLSSVYNSMMMQSIQYYIRVTDELNGTAVIPARMAGTFKTSETNYDV